MTDKEARPFLKWAGGKTQLISAIKMVLPKDICKSRFTYIEPFVGSGAVLFWMLKNFPNLKKAVINDINSDLINTYKIIAAKPKELISILEILQSEYHLLDGQEERKKELEFELAFHTYLVCFFFFSFLFSFFLWSFLSFGVVLYACR